MAFVNDHVRDSGSCRTRRFGLTLVIIPGPRRNSCNHELFSYCDDKGYHTTVILITFHKLGISRELYVWCQLSPRNNNGDENARSLLMAYWILLRKCIRVVNQSTLLALFQEYPHHNQVPSFCFFMYPMLLLHSCYYRQEPNHVDALLTLLL